MESYRGLKFRIYPDKKQKEVINQIIRNSNFIYNYYIRKQQDSFKKTGEFLPLSQCIRELPELKKKIPDLKKGESTSLQQSLRHLDTAYTKFFNNQAYYPRFKSNNLNHSYTCTKNGCKPSNIRFENNELILPKLGRIKIKLHRPIPENLDITSATVQITPSGKYEVSLQTKTEIEDKEIKSPKKGGIVYSPEKFFITSDGEFGEIPENYLKIEEKIKLIKKKLKRKQVGSSNRIKENNKLKNAYRKSLNIKRDILHKWSRELADKYDIITILKEEESPKYSQEGWSIFIQMLDYKLKEKGGKLQIIEDDELSNNLKSFSFKEKVEEARRIADLAN